MFLKDIFSKQIDRPIEGVIKADDDASLIVEMEEYVLTNEIEKRLESFLEAYNNSTGANGVWVSGFFGSGKSHLLKMLALLMENRKIDGLPALDIFLPKCGENAILKGALKKAVSSPSQSILFNIDQRADVISKKQIDALLAVFVKVFDEICGYYGKQGHIAQFERDLDSRGLYGRFQQAYETLAGKSWAIGREQVLLEGQNVSLAYAKATGEDIPLSTDIIGQYRSQYKMSIEDFAERIWTYLEKREPGFRLNFFVDEVGQYIAENVKLMTNLQTIAESLATRCRGRAWLIVTAQEDMGTILGDMSQKQAHDFSKIQARFKNRMKLTSQDVDEVIQKRLLQKNEAAAASLAALYQERSNSFKTMFDFADGSHGYRNFQDKDHFINCYPFIPYQFALFQAAIQGLSLHNAFEGKHSSVGERSMLGVFQQVAINIRECSVGQLAAFDLMFEGIRATLKSQIQKAILQAEKNLDDRFAVRLLKSLFLVKYIKEFKPTVRNLGILMLESFEEDLPALKKRVEEALNLLENQTYIHRNGELYEYLTNEEKDVEEEIKNTEIENKDILAEFESLIFEGIIKERKVRHDNGQDYPFAKKIDDRLCGRDYDLSINIITPFNENAGNEQVWQTNNLRHDELLVILPADKRLMDDLLMFKRIDKYVRQNTSLAQKESIKRILTDKSHRNQDRRSDLLQQLQNLITQAKIYIMGSPLDSVADNAQARVFRGFKELIACAYPHLRMLREVRYTEDDIGKYLRPADQGVLVGGDAALSEAEIEELAFIAANKRGGLRTTLKSLVEKFQRQPYGWPYPAILCLVAALWARGKVEIRRDGALLESVELEKALRNSAAHGQLVLEPQMEIPGPNFRALKDFYEELFDSPGFSGEAPKLAADTSEALKKLVKELDILVAQIARFPFRHTLDSWLADLISCQDKPYLWYFDEFVRRRESFLQLKEELYEPIRKFMNGPQREIYENAKTFMEENEANFSYAEDYSVKQIIAVLEAPDCFKGAKIPQLKDSVSALREKVAANLAQELAIAQKAVCDLKERVYGLAEYAKLKADQRLEIDAEFDVLAASLEKQRLIPVLRDVVRRFEEVEYPRLWARVGDWANPGREKSEAGKKELISIRATKIPFLKPFLADEDDVDSYLKNLREALLAEIRQGKRIQI